MNVWLTEIEAIDPYTHELCLWAGPRIRAKSFEQAEKYCQSKGFGYCKVIGKLTDEITKDPDLCLN